MWRTGLLTGLTSLWWVVALSVESEYGLNILRFTESIRVVSVATLPAEILRGLGNWYFYGGDAAGLWSDARPFYTQRFWLIFISLMIPAIAMLAAAIVRWKYRAFFVVMLLVGLAISVGTSPYDDPSILGGAYKSFAPSSAFGFALRNTIRAGPLVALGLAVLVGVGVNALVGNLRATRWRPVALLAAALVGVICLVNAIPALTGHYYNKPLQRALGDSRVLDPGGQAPRCPAPRHAVLVSPGTPFATYRWGDMKDPVEPGLMDRQYVDRELVPAGTQPSANLCNPSTTGSRSRPSGVSSPTRWRRSRAHGRRRRRAAHGPADRPVPAHHRGPALEDVHRSHAHGARRAGHVRPPDSGQAALARPRRPHPRWPEGPGPSAGGGSPGRGSAPDRPREVGPRRRWWSTATAKDSWTLLQPASWTRSGSSSIRRRTEHDSAKLRRVAPGAALIVTDSNRRRGTRWSGMTNNYGYTEQAGEEPLRSDPLDQRLEPFPGATDTSRTVTILSGVKSVRATTYGSPS